MKVTAKVQITLEVILSQPWNEECPVSEIVRQAKASAAISVNNLLHNTHPDIRVIGNVRVQMVVAELEDKP